MSKPTFPLLFLLLTSLTQTWIIMWKQCDPRWGGNQLGFGRNTICSAGCLMTSVSMAVTMTVGLADPSTVNDWLRNNGGYVGGTGDYIWGAVRPLGLQFGGFST